MTAPSVRTDFVGREIELRLLHTCLADAARGRGQLVLVSGDPGIGKSRLLEEAVASLPEGRVLWGRCREGPGAPAYWPWTQALRSYVERAPPDRLGRQASGLDVELARIAPFPRAGAPRAAAPLERADAGAGRFRLFDAVTEFLHRVAADEPLVVVLDDLHWADSESLLLLRFLGTEIAAAGLVVAGTYREVEMRQAAAVPHILADLARLSRRVTLTGLSEREVVALADRGGAALPAAALAELHRTTEGNPFFVKELVALVRRHDWTGGAHVPIPQEVRGAIRRRLEPLAPAGRRLLGVGAVLGREFDATLLAQVAEIADADALGVLAEAVAIEAVLEVRGALPRFRFAHALVQDTLYEDLPATERARIHHRAGVLLEAAAAADPTLGCAEIAHHFLRGVGRDALARAVVWAERAAEQALASLGYEEAAGHYERALVVLPQLGGDPAERLRLLLALGDAQARAGHVEGVRATFLEAAGIARERRDATALAHAAIGYGCILPWQEVDPTLVGLLEEARAALAGSESWLRARVTAALAEVRYHALPIDESDALAREAVALARASGHPPTLAAALRALYFRCVGKGAAADRLVVILEVVRAADAAGDEALGCEARLYASQEHFAVGDVTAADRLLAAGVERAARLGLPRQRWQATVNRAMRALAAGRLAEAEGLAEEALAAIKRGVHESDARAFHAAMLFNVRRAQGRLGELAPLLAAVTAEAGGAIWHSATALAYAETGETEQAARLLEELATRGFRDLAPDWSRVPCLALLADVAAAAGDAAAARLLYPLLEVEATPVIMTLTGCLGARDRYLGALAGAFGDYERAIAHCERAVETHARMDLPVELARSRVGLAEVLAARDAPGDAARAAAALDEAEACGRALGLGRILQEVERRRGSPASAAPLIAPPTAAVLRRDGNEWLVACGPESMRLRETKGIAYLVRLLRAPGHELHVLDLVGAAAASPEPASEARRRLADLREELAEAEELHDLGRIDALRDRIEELAERLVASMGAAGAGRGRSMAAASSEESVGARRARLNVTRAIAAVVRKIAARCPRLGSHLETSVRTGRVCAYHPDPASPVVWEW